MERSLSDPKLGEVRAVLERLQTFAADPGSTQAPHQASNGAAVNGHATSAHQAGSPEAIAHAPLRSDSGIPESVGKRRAPAAIGFGIAGLVLILLGVGWLVVLPRDRGELSAAATPDVTTAGRAISERDASVRDASVGDASIRDASVRDTSVRDTSVKEPPPPVRPSRAAIDAAQDLLSRGQVQAARKQLLGLASADAADVAWMLA